MAANNLLAGPSIVSFLLLKSLGAQRGMDVVIMNYGSDTFGAMCIYIFFLPFYFCIAWRIEYFSS